MKTDGMIRKSVFHSKAKGKMSKAASSRTTLLLKAKDVGEEDEGFHYSDFDENEVEMKLCRLAHFHGILEHLLQLRSVFDNVDGELSRRRIVTLGLELISLYFSICFDHGAHVATTDALPIQSGEGSRVQGSGNGGGQ